MVKSIKHICWLYDTSEYLLVTINWVLLRIDDFSGAAWNKEKSFIISHWRCQSGRFCSLSKVFLIFRVGNTNFKFLTPFSSCHNNHCQWNAVWIFRHRMTKQLVYFCMFFLVSVLYVCLFSNAESKHFFFLKKESWLFISSNLVPLGWVLEKTYLAQS